MNFVVIFFLKVSTVLRGGQQFWEGIMVPAADFFWWVYWKHDGGQETWVSIMIRHGILVIKIHSGRDACSVYSTMNNAYIYIYVHSIIHCIHTWSQRDQVGFPPPGDGWAKIEWDALWGFWTCPNISCNLEIQRSITIIDYIQCSIWFLSARLKAFRLKHTIWTSWFSINGKVFTAIHLVPASRFLGADSLLALAKCFEEAKNTFLDISREAHQTWMQGRWKDGRIWAPHMELEELQWVGDKEKGKKEKLGEMDILFESLLGSKKKMMKLNYFPHQWRCDEDATTTTTTTTSSHSITTTTVATCAVASVATTLEVHRTCSNILEDSRVKDRMEVPSLGPCMACSWQSSPIDLLQIGGWSNQWPSGRRSFWILLTYSDLWPLFGYLAFCEEHRSWLEK